MIGFRSVQHQGWVAAKTAQPHVNMNGTDVFMDAHNPYPKGCGAFYEYQDGCNAYRRGDVINCRGDIENPRTAAIAAQHRRQARYARQQYGY